LDFAREAKFEAASRLASDLKYAIAPRYCADLLRQVGKEIIDKPILFDLEKSSTALLKSLWKSTLPPDLTHGKQMTSCSLH
jgi:hypothetical protein